MHAQCALVVHSLQWNVCATLASIFIAEETGLQFYDERGRAARNLLHPVHEILRVLLA